MGDGYSVIQVGNGWLNSRTGRYTYYDANSGQMITRQFVPNRAPGQENMSQQQLMEGLQNGTININQYLAPEQAGYLGGRSNVNVQRQIGEAAKRIQSLYPQMKYEDAVKYAHNWVTERMSRGWDANEIENMMKDVTRGENSINEDFIRGVTGNINADEMQAKDPNATGASSGIGPDPRGSIQDELRAFAGRMMSVLPPDSPQVQRIAELAAQAGNKYATQTGLGPGGITATGVANTTSRNLTDLQTQREGIGANALAAAGNQQLSVDALNTQLQQANQQANTLQGGNIGGLVGSAVGAIGGIVGTAYTNGAMAPAIPGLIQAGGAGGSAIGGTIANGAQGPIQYGGQPQQQSSYKGRSWGTS